jgi:hypothetical protein
MEPSNNVNAVTMISDQLVGGNTENGLTGRVTTRNFEWRYRSTVGIGHFRTYLFPVAAACVTPARILSRGLETNKPLGVVYSES